MVVSTAGAALSHVGKVRQNNQDSGYAGVRLFIVADGMGGHAGGDVASAIAVQRIAGADETDYDTPHEAEFALHSALISANQLISETVYDHPELMGMGTTVSAMVRVDDAIVIAHIGDSRVYLLREGELSQITHDHTFVQRLVDTGRISPEEAAVHPRRSVLMRVLGDIDQSPEIDTSILGTVAGDRWLLCSDGLSSYVPEERILAALSEAHTADEATARLVDAALDAGAPDNVTSVVVDIDRPDEPDSADRVPLVVGSAASPLELDLPADHRQHVRLPSLLLHPIRATSTPREASFEADSQDYLDALIREDRIRLWRRRIFWLAALLVLIAGLVFAAFGAYRYTQTRFYVGFDNGTVAIFQGVQPQVGPLRLSHVVESTTLTENDLSSFYRQRVEQTINADSLREAQEIVQRLEGSSDG